MTLKVTYVDVTFIMKEPKSKTREMQYILIAMSTAMPMGAQTSTAFHVTVHLPSKGALH